MPLPWLLALVASTAGCEPFALPHQHQLLVEIRIDRVDLRIGDEIPVTFAVTNVGTETYKYSDRSYDRSGRMNEYRLEAMDAQGASVPDPRTLSRVRQGYIGGGLSRFSELAPGEHHVKTIPLNLWALVTTPGVYTVVGRYAIEGGGTVESAPITVRILPRTESEMALHIQELAAQLHRAEGRDARVHLVQRLMYTADSRAAEPLLEAADQDNNTAFWIGEAFSYYIPKDRAALDAAVSTIRRLGLQPSSVRILEQLGAPRETVMELIERSLMSADDARRAEAALAAQRYPADRFAAGLIELAAHGSELTRIRAIYALARHRTDAGVAALRRLLQEPVPVIRTTTQGAIESAYRIPSSGPGRPLRIDDFPEIAKR